MANQIVVSAGAKVRNLSGVLTGTSGVVSSVPLGAANGVATLDSGGKVPVSQLPSSVVTYLGTWNAATNTPTLANGTGDAGDMYICNVAGTVNFGAGPVVFVVGDWVLYGSGTWQKSSGQNGTVTSVAITETGDSLNITGSPITTSGTINIGFNGTNLQYVNGAGNLTTFPILTGYVPYTGATANLNLGIYSFIANDGAYNTEMSPSYFGVENAAGTIFGLLEYNKLTLTNSTGAGSTMIVNAQGLIFPDASVQTSSYTDAKARLALSLTTTGTSGVATYNNATGVFNIPNYGSALTGYVPYTGATTDVDLGAFKLNAQSLHIKGTGGNGHLGLKHQSASATASANEVSLFADSLGDLSWLNGNLYLSKFITSGNTAARSYTFPDATCNIPNDSLVVHLAGTETITGAKTFSGGVTFSSSVTTNNLTFANSGFFLTLQPPTLSVNRTVTFADITGTIAMLEGTQTFTGYKTFDAALELKYNVIPTPSSVGNIGIGSNGVGITITTKPVSTVYNNNLYFASASNTFTFPNASGTIALVGGSGVGTVTSVAALTIGTSGTDLSSTVATSTTTPVITLNVPTASATNRGALSSADWSTFNSKQGTITLTTTGTSGAATFSSNTLNIPNYGSALSGYLPLTGGTLTGALNGTSATFSGNVGVGVAATAAKLQVLGYVNDATLGNVSIRTTDNLNNSLVFSHNTSFVDIRSNEGLRFYTGTSFLTLALTLASTGAATFTSSVSGHSLTIQNTNSGYYSSSDYLDNSGTEKLIVGYANSGAGALASKAIIYGTSGVGLNFYTNGSTTAKMVIDTTGNVAIGTVSPQAKFSIGSPSAITIFPTYSTNDLASIGWNYFALGDELYVRSMDIVSKGAPDGTNGGSIMRFLTTPVTNASAAVERMRITSGGNVLIGTTTDSGYKLDVNGTGRFSGALSGTSATFSGTINANSANSQLRIGGATTDAFIGVSTSTLYLTDWATALKGLTINLTTGAATFSSTCTATGFFESSSIKGKDIIATNPLLSLDIDVIKYTRKSDESKDIRYGYSAEQIHSLMPELTDKDVTAVKYLDVHTILIANLQKEIRDLKAKINN